MDTEQVLALSDKEIIQISEQLRVAYRLKSTLRYAGARDASIHGESVAEHIFALLFLCQYFLPLEDPKEELDKMKIHEILLFHDFGEILNGDIPYHLKTPADEDREKKDAEVVFKSLPQPLGMVGRDRWEEYASRDTQESRFAYALDKIEPLFELLDPISQTSLKRTKFTYEMHVSKKLKATEGFPVMRKFTDVLSAHMKERGIFWEEGSE